MTKGAGVRAVAAPQIEIVLAPFHAGVRDHRVGRGPGRLLREGLAERLTRAGAAVELSDIGDVDAFEGEIGRSFEVMRRVARAVSSAARRGRFPIVLAGNCNTTVGVWAGLERPGAGLVWFDAHPDFDTPDEATSGYFDGMGVATLTGQCWRGLAATVPGFRPTGEDRILYCGIRDFEHGQDEKVRASHAAAVFGSAERRIDFPSDLREAATKTQFSEVVVHVDLDCLDTSVGLANEYAAPGGLTAEDLVDCMDVVCDRLRPLAATVASFNPDLEGGDRIAAAGVAAIVRLVERLGGSAARLEPSG